LPPARHELGGEACGPNTLNAIVPIGAAPFARVALTAVGEIVSPIVSEDVALTDSFGLALLVANSAPSLVDPMLYLATAVQSFSDVHDTPPLTTNGFETASLGNPALTPGAHVPAVWVNMNACWPEVSSYEPMAAQLPTDGHETVSTDTMLGFAAAPAGNVAFTPVAQVPDVSDRSRPCGFPEVS
jgi:hypothetical protein